MRGTPQGYVTDHSTGIAASPTHAAGHADARPIRGNGNIAVNVFTDGHFKAVGEAPHSGRSSLPRDCLKADIGGEAVLRRPG